MHSSAKSTSTATGEQLGIGDIDEGRRFERGADALGRPFDLERAGDDAAQIAQPLPLPCQRRRRARMTAPPGKLRDGPSDAAGSRASHASSAVKQSIGASQVTVARNRWSSTVRHALRVDRRIRVAIERVLADIEIERRQIDGHEGVERGEDALVVEIGVGRAHQRDRARRADAASAARAPACRRGDYGRRRGNARGCRASSAACCAACGRSRRWFSGFPARCAGRRHNRRRRPTAAEYRRPIA